MSPCSGLQLAQAVVPGPPVVPTGPSFKALKPAITPVHQTLLSLRSFLSFFPSFPIPHIGFTLAGVPTEPAS